MAIECKWMSCNPGNSFKLKQKLTYSVALQVHHYYVLLYILFWGELIIQLYSIMTQNLKKSVLHLVCLIWKFSRGGWRTAFLSGNTKWQTNSYCLCSSINNVHFKEFWILILQYNNSRRAPWKRCTKFEPKSKSGSKHLWIELNSHNHD